MENEIEEAMSDTILGANDDKNDLDGKYITSKNKPIIGLQLVLAAHRTYFPQLGL